MCANGRASSSSSLLPHYRDVDPTRRLRKSRSRAATLDKDWTQESLPCFAQRVEAGDRCCVRSLLGSRQKELSPQTVTQISTSFRSQLILFDIRTSDTRGEPHAFPIGAERLKDQCTTSEDAQRPRAGRGKIDCSPCLDQRPRCHARYGSPPPRAASLPESGAEPPAVL